MSDRTTIGDLLAALPPQEDPVAADDLQQVLLGITEAVGKLSMILRRAEMSERPLPRISWSDVFFIDLAIKDLVRFRDGRR